MTSRTAILLILLVGCASAQTDSRPAMKLESARFETTDAHRVGPLYLSGPIAAEDLPALKRLGIKEVVSLSTPPKTDDWNPGWRRNVKGMSFKQLPFGPAKKLEDARFDAVRRALRARGKRLFLAASKNDLAAAWLPFRVLDQLCPLEKAVAEARTLGLQDEGLEKRARSYIAAVLEKTRGRLSAKPGINDPFTAKTLDVDAFVKRFELESREVYAGRKSILDACKLRPGEAIADIGAGTGLFTKPMSQAVGPKGWVYAVDIAPKFLSRINGIAVREKLANVTAVLCQETSVNLPPASIDAAFICDTYHHFEYPQLSLASIHRALKPKGRMVIIDFERIPGKSRKWILGHVRAGKETVRKEIESAGFKLLEEPRLKELKENYCLIFERTD